MEYWRTVVGKTWRDCGAVGGSGLLACGAIALLTAYIAWASFGQAWSTLVPSLYPSLIAIGVFIVLMLVLSFLKQTGMMYAEKDREARLLRSQLLTEAQKAQNLHHMSILVGVFQAQVSQLPKESVDFYRATGGDMTHALPYLKEHLKTLGYSWDPEDVWKTWTGQQNSLVKLLDRQSADDRTG